MRVHVSEAYVPAVTMARSHKRSSDAAHDPRKRARDQPPSRAVKTYVKRALRATRELKFTQFIQTDVGDVVVPLGNELVIRDLVGSNVAKFPAQGDARNQREGAAYRLKGFNVFFGIRTLQMYTGECPLSIYFMRVPSRYAIVNGLIPTDNIFPMSDTTDITTWASMPIIVGKPDSKYGTIIKKVVFHPMCRTTPSDGNWELAADTGTVPATSTGRGFHVYLPVNKHIETGTTAAEVPNEIDKYMMMIHCPQTSGQSQYAFQYLYLQTVFVDA